jgi:DNA polymerase bacteriophage-type
MRTVHWDMETRSAVSLRECGAYVYSIDSTTQLLCLVFVVDDGDPQLRLPPDPVPPVFFEIASDPSNWQLIAHNWEFERAILENILIPRYGFQPIPIEVQHCSQRLALANAYPAELDLLAQAVGLPYRKDPAARKAMLAVSRPKAQRKRKATTVPLQLLYERCKLDVITTRAVWQSPKLRQLSSTERHYQIQDATINARGIRCDRAFVTAARDLAVRERTAINLKLQELTHDTITSVDQTKRFLAAINVRGHEMASLNKAAVAQVLARKPDDYVRQLLELRRTGAGAAVNKFKRMLAYASPGDDRMRGTLRMYGGAPGRWAGLGPQLQNLKKNESNLPLAVVDSVRTGDRAGIARYGNPLALLGDISRAALCAGAGMELKAGDFSAVESVVLAWLANERWKLAAYQTYQQTGDTTLEPYRVIARKMLHKPANAEINSAERQLGKCAELASGFGGSVGAWRRIIPHDSRSDEEIKAIIQQWRAAHPAVCKFWKDIARAARVAIRTGQPILVAPSPQPPITAAFADGNLTLTLPSGRAITYPGARLIPSKYEDAPPDVQFLDNARGQWKPYRGWFGTFVENGHGPGSARRRDRALRDAWHRRRVPLPRRGHRRGADGIVVRPRVPGNSAEAAQLGDRTAAQWQGALGTALSRASRAGGQTTGCGRSRRGGARPGDRQLHRRHTRRSRSDRRSGPGRARGRRGLRRQLGRQHRAADRAGQLAADPRQQGLLPVPRRRRAIVRDLRGPFLLLRLRGTRQPARLVKGGRGHDRGGGRRP